MVKDILDFLEWQREIAEQEYEAGIEKREEGSFCVVYHDGVELCAYPSVPEAMAFLEGYRHAQKCEA